MTYLASVFDHAGNEPHPAKDRQRVRLPHEEQVEREPRTADVVEAVLLSWHRENRAVSLGELDNDRPACDWLRLK